MIALSSGPLLSTAAILGVYMYDRILNKSSARWKVLAVVLAALIVAIFTFANRPFSWIVSHLTLDPQTGYFRLYIFDYVIEQIKSSPLVGIGFGPAGSDEFRANASVDCAWLVYTQRFGIPMIVFFALTNFASFLQFGTRPSQPTANRDMMNSSGYWIFLSFSEPCLNWHDGSFI